MEKKRKRLWIKADRKHWAEWWDDKQYTASLDSRSNQCANLPTSTHTQSLTILLNQSNFARVLAWCLQMPFHLHITYTVCRFSSNSHMQPHSTSHNTAFPLFLRTFDWGHIRGYVFPFLVLAFHPWATPPPTTPSGCTKLLCGHQHPVSNGRHGRVRT